MDNATDEATTTSVSPDHVLSVAVTMFSESGYKNTKLEAIAKASGMTKRMIHYHFGDKRGLYARAVTAAIERLHVPEQDLDFESTVPVDGVRSLIDALFNTFEAHPESVRLLLWESLAGPTRATEQLPFSDESNMTLYLDRLLLLGQEAGAFRPGISALDVYSIFTSLMFYRISNSKLIVNLYGIDLQDEANTVGMRRLITDAVLSFLTSNMANTGETSYITRPAGNSESADASDSLYGDGGSNLSDSVIFIDE
ncbi:TetR/AcrR family transcriptional regulator [Corynebacterium tapiri]|uniref:TetR/AcrR family transcriptional regulator n=1 Tax=Corynebacterium tapiri TaxID=1448266 RepID=A0A5C4U3H9_9CORY|nr:TetR/AcrR family transcriptional regulator [Corynebacterium tapiri]TNL96655.1 TetR/AcrR family transcriptional regulator [Corynebacterium tapiri]